jgi:hypothetical protein
MIKPKRNKYKEFVFNDHPDFRPNLSPIEMFKLGSFGGTYWRPIYSSITKKHYKNKYPKSWLKIVTKNHLIKSWNEYDKSINKYKVKVGTTLEYWESKGWITKYHPYGWVQWYVDFFSGKRCADDERQIKRWLGIAGPHGRFKQMLINIIKKKKGKYNDFTISPKIRQTLQHWAYVIRKKDV